MRVWHLQENILNPLESPIGVHHHAPAILWLQVIHPFPLSKCLLAVLASCSVILVGAPLHASQAIHAQRYRSPGAAATVTGEKRSLRSLRLPAVFSLVVVLLAGSAPLGHGSAVVLNLTRDVFAARQCSGPDRSELPCLSLAKVQGS